jgi:NAD(P)-dependent dehydrogenase (short-subunit alcohol dehydrogenase family)
MSKTAIISSELTPSVPGIVDSGPLWPRLTPEGRERMFAGFPLRAPAKRVAVPAERANAVLFVLTNSFLTGSVLPIDRGARLM